MELVLCGVLFDQKIGSVLNLDTAYIRGCLRNPIGSVIINLDQEITKDNKRTFMEDLPRKNRSIALMNNKGGVTKTTTAFNIAKNFIRNGRSVVCVDFDQQEQLQGMLPDITRSDIRDPQDIPDINSDYVIVDTGPTFSMEHMELMDAVDMIIMPIQLESLDVEQSVKLLKTIKRIGHCTKTKIILIHSGKHTLMYKNLMPLIANLTSQFGVDVLCEMKKSQAVPQATLQKKTVFEIQSPPEVRKEFKLLFKEIARHLNELAPIAQGLKVKKPSFKGGEECLAH